MYICKSYSYCTSEFIYYIAIYMLIEDRWSSPSSACLQELALEFTLPYLSVHRWSNSPLGNSLSYPLSCWPPSAKLTGPSSTNWTMTIDSRDTVDWRYRFWFLLWFLVNGKGLLGKMFSKGICMYGYINSMYSLYLYHSSILIWNYTPNTSKPHTNALGACTYNHFQRNKPNHACYLFVQIWYKFS